MAWTMLSDKSLHGFALPYVFSSAVFYDIKTVLMLLSSLPQFYGGKGKAKATFVTKFEFCDMLRSLRTSMN